MLGNPQATSSGNRWDAIRGTINGTEPLTGTYQFQVDDVRMPSMVPGNTQWLTPAIKAGAHPQLSDEQVQRAIDYAKLTGNVKPASDPMSPLGSEFDFYNPSGARLNDLRALSLREFLKGKK